MLALMLMGCSNTKQTVKVEKEMKWEESPALVQVIENQNRTKIENVFRIGDNGELGFGEYGPFIAGESQKYMWHFWGDKKTLTKPFKVIGINKETGEEITVFQVQAQNLAPNNGADHHLPSTMMLPSPGLWRLEAYFGDKLFGNVVVNVTDWQLRDQYVKAEKVLLTVSPNPNLMAGKPFGYVFHFTASFNTFKGKQLAVYAYHK
jgi:hypothetical protein